MIWRSTILFITSLAAVTVPVASLQAQSNPVLMAQSSTVDPNAAIDTGQAVPNFSGASPRSELQQAASEQQINELKSVQQKLKNRGYYNGPIDGIYGPQTDAAIRSIRQQEGNELFGVTPTSPAITAPDAVAEAEQPEAPAADADDTSVRINAENIPEDTEAIDIGDSVSPETGVDTSEPDTEPETAAPEPALSSSDASPGLNRLLWPGLALIATLGSFGIGFLFANRVKPSADENGADSALGAIPDAVQQSDDYQISPQTSHNGRANGHSSADVGNVIMPLSDQTGDSLAVMDNAGMVSPTTRLAKVDVIDELVANLHVADPSRRRKAIWELGQRGNSSAVQHLVNGMVDADSKEKSLILAALSEIGIRSLKPMNRALAIALQDENPDVRKNAIRDLTRVYDLVTQISQMLGHATEDEDPEVRRTAQWALEQLNRIREAPKLQASIDSLESTHATAELLPDEVKNLKN